MAEKISEGLHIAEYKLGGDRAWLREHKKIIHHEIMAGPIAGLAMQLMQHFAVVAATPDGEDSSGRQKMRLATPEEVVNRCCELAALSFDAFAERGWILKTLPFVADTDEASE